MATDLSSPTVATVDYDEAMERILAFASANGGIGSLHGAAQKLMVKLISMVVMANRGDSHLVDGLVEYLREESNAALRLLVETPVVH